MNIKELNDNLNKIKQLLTYPDYDKIDVAIQLIQSLKEPKIYKHLLKGIIISNEGKIDRTNNNYFRDENEMLYYNKLKDVNYESKTFEYNVRRKVSEGIQIKLESCDIITKKISELPSIFIKSNNLQHFIDKEIKYSPCVNVAEYRYITYESYDHSASIQEIIDEAVDKKEYDGECWNVSKENFEKENYSLSEIFDGWYLFTYMDSCSIECGAAAFRNEELCYMGGSFERVEILDIELNIENENEFPDGFNKLMGEYIKESINKKQEYDSNLFDPEYKYQSGDWNHLGASESSKYSISDRNFGDVETLECDLFLAENESYKYKTYALVNILVYSMDFSIFTELNRNVLIKIIKERTISRYVKKYITGKSNEVWIKDGEGYKVIPEKK